MPAGTDLIARGGSHGGGDECGVSGAACNNVPLAPAEYVAKDHVTQVLAGHSAVTGWKKCKYYLALRRFMNAAPDVDVHIVTQQG